MQQDETWADQIYQVLEKAERPLHIREIYKRVCRLRGLRQGEVDRSIISAIARDDNAVNRIRGYWMRFNTFADGREKMGYISIRKPPNETSWGMLKMEKRKVRAKRSGEQSKGLLT
jgi:hypothetical protein